MPTIEAMDHLADHEPRERGPRRASPYVGTRRTVPRSSAAVAFAATTLASLLALTACTPLGREVRYGSVQPLSDVRGHVVTNLDLYTSGERAVAEYVAAMPAPQREQTTEVIRRARQATARFRVCEIRGTSLEFVTGTGVCVRGSDASAVLLSAGHVFRSKADERHITATRLDGTQCEATVLACEFEGLGKTDYAVLRCVVPQADTTAWAGRAAPRVGELVVAVGYSDDCGLDPDGHVLFIGARVDPRIAPLVSLHEVQSLEPFVLAPVAGAMPSHGASGGGLFDLDGNVVGVFSGVQYEFDDVKMFMRIVGYPITAIRSIP